MAEMDIHKGGNMMLNSTEINGNSSTGFSNGILYFSNLLENLSDAFIATDADFNIIQWNKAAELIYGWKAAQVIGLPIAEVLKTEYLMGSSDDAVQQIELKGVWNNRVIQSRKNGEKISVYSTVSAVKDDDGKLVGLAAINRDITDRKLAEQSLRESELKYSVLFDKAAMPASLTKIPENVFVEVNDAFERIFGYTRKEVIGKTSLELGLIRPEEQARTIEEVHQYGMAVGNEKHIFTKSGEMRIIVANVSMVEIDQQSYAITTLQDITERKQADERFQLAVESAPNAIVMVNQNGEIILVNAQAEKYFGYLRDELIGRSVDLFIPQRFKDIHPGHRADFISSPQVRAMGVGRDLFALRKDGSEFPVEIGLVPLETQDGTFVMATIVDITERKQAEEEMRRLNQELEAFAYSVSHDLRAPLRGIDGFSSVLVQKYESLLDEQGVHYLERIKTNVHRMSFMINDLLLLAKMTRHELRREDVNLSAIANEILAELMAQEPGRSIRIEVEQQVTEWCDAGLIHIVLQNLLGNALKFTSKKDESLIQFGRAPRNRFGKMVYFVRDNGVGFDMTYADKLFSAFQRLHTENEFPGTGIGLATVQRIIHRHGGRIWAEAGLGQGAAFFFTLGGFHE